MQQLSVFRRNGHILDPSDASLVVSPSEGLLRPGEAVALEISLISLADGPLHLSSSCAINNGDGVCDRLLVSALVLGSRIRFHQPEVDLGLLSVGGRVEKALRFANEGTSPCQWRVEQIHLPSADVSSDAASAPSASRVDHTNDVRSRRLSELSTADDTRTSLSTGGSVTARLPESSGVAVHCEPSSGTLGPGEVVVTRVVCRAGLTPDRIRTALRCISTAVARAEDEHLESGKGDWGRACREEFISVRGEVQAPLVFLSHTEVPVGTCFSGITIRRTVRLTNLSNLSTRFKWERPLGTDRSFALTFTPVEGTLGEKESMEVAIDFTPQRAGNVTDLCACRVFGMPQPLGFELTATVMGVTVSYELLGKEDEPPAALGLPTDLQFTGTGVLPTPAPPPKLHFGDAVPLFERRHLRFVIRNLSAIAAPFSLSPGKYKIPAKAAGAAAAAAVTAAAVGAASVGLRRGTGVKRHRVLDNAHETTGAFYSEAGRRHVLRQTQVHEDKVVLSNGQGAAFTVTPSQGVLPPWGVVVVTLEAFNNMPGTYNDDLECVLQGTPLTRLNIRLGVKGCPLRLLGECVGIDVMTDPSLPRLRFGDFVRGTPNISKLVRVQNDGPISAKVRWTVHEADEDPEAALPVELAVEVLPSPILVGAEEAAGPEDDPSTQGTGPQRPNGKTSPGGLTARPSPGRRREVVRVRLRLREVKKYVPPFEVTPATSVIKPHSNATFSVALRSKHSEGDIASLMVLDAEWQNQRPHAASSNHMHTGLGAGAGAAGSSAALLASGDSLAGGAGGLVRSSMGSVASRESLRSDGGLDKETKGAVRVMVTAKPIHPKLLLDKASHKDRPMPQSLKFVGHSTQVKEVAGRKRQDPGSYHESQLKTVVLSNPHSVAVTCAVSCTEPFAILATQCLAPPHPMNLANQSGAAATGAIVASRTVSQGGIFTLPPSENLKVLMAYSPSLAGSRSKERNQGSTTGLKIEEKGVLNVKFATGQEQHIELTGVVLRPMIVCAPVEFDYGIIRAGQTWSMTLFLSNPTEVSTRKGERGVPGEGA